MQLECLRERTLDNNYIRQRQRQWDGKLYGFSQQQHKFQDSGYYSRRQESHGDPNGSILHILNLANEQVFYIQRGHWFNCRNHAWWLQLDSFRECRLDNDHLGQQRQRKWDGELYSFGQHRCK